MTFDLLDLLDEILAADEKRMVGRQVHPGERADHGIRGCGIHRYIYDDDAHVVDCWKFVCPSCGDEVHNGFLMRLNHEGSDGAVCPSIRLRLNHLAYAQRNGEEPDERDLSVLDLGYGITEDGEHIYPEGKS